jgi:predicted nucleotidyltransferase
VTLKLNMSFELEEPFLFSTLVRASCIEEKLTLEMESESVKYLVLFGSIVSNKNNIFLNDLSICVKLFPFSFKR